MVQIIAYNSTTTIYFSRYFHSSRYHLRVPLCLQQSSATITITATTTNKNNHNHNNKTKNNEVGRGFCDQLIAPQPCNNIHMIIDHQIWLNFLTGNFLNAGAHYHGCITLTKYVERKKTITTISSTTTFLSLGSFIAFFCALFTPEICTWYQLLVYE